MKQHTLDALRRTSIDIILDNQHPSGAYPASPTFSVYGYSWFRDGAFIADAMSRVGQAESASAFNHWCRGVLESRADHITDLVERARADESIPASEMLPTRYTLDGLDGSDEWWDFQLDGYGTWLWTLTQHAERHGEDLEEFETSIELAVDYLCEFGLEPCFDWWEEFAEHRHTSTIASVAAGLRSIEHRMTGDRARRVSVMLARLDETITGSLTTSGSLAKWQGNDSVDASLLSVMIPFGVVEPGTTLAEATYRQILDDLLVTDPAVGGLYRYRGDTFFGGGEWINLTAWLGWYEAETGRIDEARGRLAWIAAQATDDGSLPEQVSDNTQFPDRVQEWIDKWGPVATPLLWSHAMFLTLDDVLTTAPSTDR